MSRKNQSALSNPSALSDREREIQERNLSQQQLQIQIQQQQQQQQQQPHHLLEEISRDDRGGLVLVAAENLICESFEVAVPLRIYGAVQALQGTAGVERGERGERDGNIEEGLAV